MHKQNDSLGLPLRRPHIRRQPQPHPGRARRVEGASHAVGSQGGVGGGAGEEVGRTKRGARGGHLGGDDRVGEGGAEAGVHVGCGGVRGWCDVGRATSAVGGGGEGRCANWSCGVASLTLSQGVSFSVCPRALTHARAHTTHTHTHSHTMLSRTATALAARAVTVAGARALASLPAVADAESPFLRFASPAPANVDLTPALAGLPETKVWGREGRAGR